MEREDGLRKSDVYPGLGMDTREASLDRPFVTLTFRGENIRHTIAMDRRSMTETALDVMGSGKLSSYLRDAGLGETRGARDVEGGGKGDGRHCVV